jgi:hypothetical protein
MDNVTMLAQMQAALKTLTVTDLGQSVLTPEQQAQFIRQIQPNTKVLDEARFKDMTREVMNIDRIGFMGRILSRGKNIDGSINVPGVTKPVTATNQLIAQEMVSIAPLGDDALEANIEQGNLEQTLLDIFSQAAGRDLEELGLLANKEGVPANANDILVITDGWAKLAGNAVYAQGYDQVRYDPLTYNPNDPATFPYPENVFQSMLAGIPKQYLQVRNEWRVYVPFETYDAYGNLLKQRNTALGDQAQTKGDPLPWKGFQVQEVPMLDRSLSTGAGGAGRICMLQHPNNMVWGVFRKVRIEPNRKPEERQTNFVLTLKADVGYEDENAAVVAYLDQAAPGS